ncbi:MAG: Glycosyl transferase, family 2 [Microgenomates group bacterium GW2011_GWC2_45_8]|nr:MAG: Glycosyl transferase, family 2 [Microgenomates group bacterium GW2011_GWC2_45_8]
MAKIPSVSVIIPSWNSEVQMKQNLPSVFKAAAAVQAEIVIVDDASAYDNSAKYLLSLGSKIRLYQNFENSGFSYTVNRGVKLAKGDLIILLNTDVRPSPDCFVKALKYFTDPSVYALGFNSGEAWMGGEWQGGLFHHFKVAHTIKNKNKANPSLWASDPLFKPFYWEDTDMGYRAWKRGWRVLWAPECKVVHDHPKSVIAGNFSQKFVLQTAQRNQFLFIWKNISDQGFLFRHFLRLPYYLLNYPGPVLQALVLLPRCLSKRRAERPFWKRPDRDILSLWAR